MSQYEHARNSYERALPAWRAAGDGRGEGVTISNLGIIHIALGEYERARDYSERALAFRGVSEILCKSAFGPAQRRAVAEELKL